MKKQYVSGYGKESKSKERWTFAALAGVCVLVFIITITVAIILMDEPAEEINRAEFVESEEEDIAFVESEEEEETVPVSAINEETVSEPQEWIAPCGGELLLEFSDKMPLYSETLDDWRLHTAIDISAPLGSEVRAIADGTVMDMYEDFRHGYTITIDHGDGLVGVYSNLATFSMTEKGAEVKRGQQISTVGDTTLFETIAETHLHFELKSDGTYVNPLNYFELEE